MKIKLLQLVVLMFVAFNSIEANQTFEIDLKQAKEIIAKNKVYVIGVKEETKWNKNKVQVKNFQSIGPALLEYKSSKLDFDIYSKDTAFIIYSKKDESAIKFLKKLKTLGFKNVKYLKDGLKNWIILRINFRGIKHFSMFNH